MRTYLLVTAMIISVSFGCSGKGSRGQTGGLSSGEVEYFKQLNGVLEDSHVARELAFGSGLLPAASSDKARKMADLLAERGCVANGETVYEGGTKRRTGGRPVDTFERSWVQVYDVTQADCPIYLHNRWEYAKARGEWEFFEEYLNKSDDYKELNSLVRLEGAGELRVRSNSGTTTVNGEFMYRHFELQGYGALTLSYYTSQSYAPSNRGLGTVVVTIGAPRAGWKHSAEVSWTTPNFTPRYSINGREVEPKVFQEMFSAFGHLEIMDRSLKMR